MERHLKQREKECLKSTMLKHEETFKEQICELHRLYQVQKLLMNDVKNKEKIRQATKSYSLSTPNFSMQRRPSSQASAYEGQDSLGMQNMIDLEHPVEELVIECAEDTAKVCDIEQETDIELTLGTGCNKKKKDERPSYWNACVPFPSASTKSDAGHIPLSGSNPRLNSCDRLTGPSWESFGNEQKRTYNDEEISRQKGQPRWIFPVLSLNVT